MSKKQRRIVVKVGTSTLTYESGKINLRRMSHLARVLSDLKNAGNEIILVSSGAIGVGSGKIGLHSVPQSTKERQAVAAIGQCELMFLYDKLFGEYGQSTAQLLFSKGDINHPEQKENLINTFEQLLAYGAVPVVNENDSISIDELVFGDNDHLSAIVATLVNADLLLILTDIDGLYEQDPKENPEAALISQVYEVTDKIRRIAGGRGSTRGTGGMITKIQAAEYAMEAGIDTVVLNGENPDTIYRVLEGKQIGTWFHAQNGE